MAASRPALAALWRTAPLPYRHIPPPRIPPPVVPASHRWYSLPSDRDAVTRDTPPQQSQRTDAVDHHAEQHSVSGAETSTNPFPAPAADPHPQPLDAAQSAPEHIEPPQQRPPSSPSPSPSASSPSTSSTALQQAHQRLRNHLSPLVAHARTTATHHLASLQPRLSSLNARWNAYTGFEQIAALKDTVSQLESSLAASRSELADAKSRYLSAVATRSTSQRATNDLLSRRASWSESDLSEYTRLLRSEHQQAKDEENAERRLEEAERKVQSRFDDLMKGVMSRYHDEQIWSDRVRTVSTYGSIAVVALNALLFIAAILIVEPYKRKKLAQTFETRLLEGEQKGRELVQATIQSFDAKVERLVAQLEGGGGGAVGGGVGSGLIGIDEPGCGTRVTSLATRPLSDDAATAAAVEAGMDDTEPHLDPSIELAVEDTVLHHLSFLDEGEEPSSTPPVPSSRSSFWWFGGEEEKGEEGETTRRRRRKEVALASTLGVLVGAGCTAAVSVAWGG